MEGGILLLVLVWIFAFVIGVLIVIAPLFIWHKLSLILEETKRHNKAMEVKIDIIHDLISNMTVGDEYAEES